MLSGSGGGTDHRRGDACLLVLRQYRALHTCGLRGAQDRAEVLRILHAVEHDEQRHALGLGRRLHHLLEGHVLVWASDGGHTLVVGTVHRAVESLSLHADDWDVLLGGDDLHLLQVIRPVVYAGHQVDLHHIASAECLQHRPAAVDIGLNLLVLGHRIAAEPSCGAERPPFRVRLPIVTSLEGALALVGSAGRPLIGGAALEARPAP